MLGKLPFSASVFWKTLLVVVMLTVVAWSVAVRGFHYVMTPADYVGTTISAILLTYLVHLWILPADMLQGDHKSNNAHGDQLAGPTQNQSTRS
ncbi:MAG: hypothetical protein HY287_05070 [Planctomycetes bacterium]|nr:hypothetical protein [Planctomycetota bacterium]